jgi:2-keto-3-deoxy-6-phosphogluconate aldolase
MMPFEITHRLITQHIVPVPRLESAQSTARAFESLMQAGYAVVEITMAAPGAIAHTHKFLAVPLPGRQVFAKAAHHADSNAVR